MDAPRQQFMELAKPTIKNKKASFDIYIAVLF